MKKNFKLVLALVLSIMMIAGMIPAMADGTHSISINSDDTHTYAVYQVLTGTLANDDGTDRALGNPEWGADAITNPGDVNAFITSITASGMTEKAIAEAVLAKVNTSGNGRGTVDKDNPLENLATGYYVLKDITATSDLTHDGVTDTLSLYVVKVVNDINGFTVKYDSVPDDKIITTDTLGDDATGTTVNGKIDNVSIGDTVNYKITTTVPAKASDYNYFYFVVNDTLSTGLTLNADSINVYHGSIAQGNLLTEGTLTPVIKEKENADDPDEIIGYTATEDYILKTGEDAAPCSFQVALNSAKTYAGEDIIVTYSAVLNENAEVGDVANTNTSTVIFSNDPHHNYDGTNYPGFPAEKEGSYLKETPVTETETFTTGVKITKVDENGQILTGAEFQITGTSVQTVLVTEEYFRVAESGETPEYYELNSGEFTKDAPTQEAMILTPGATAGYVRDSEGTLEVGGQKYREYVPENDGDKDVYVHQLSNEADYKDTSKTHVKDTKLTPVETSSTVKAKAFVDENGVVEFVGLGAGEYTISETTTPEGYNTLPDVTLEISFTASPEEGASHWSVGDKTSKDNSGNAIFSYIKDDNRFEATIMNNRGTQLPETGGIGTTIFYIGGSVLVLAAAILLITKRRMSSND